MGRMADELSRKPRNSSQIGGVESRIAQPANLRGKRQSSKNISLNGINLPVLKIS